MNDISCSDRNRVFNYYLIRFTAYHIYAECQAITNFFFYQIFRLLPSHQKKLSDAIWFLHAFDSALQLGFIFFNYKLQCRNCSCNAMRLIKVSNFIKTSAYQLNDMKAVLHSVHANSRFLPYLEQVFFNGDSQSPPPPRTRKVRWRILIIRSWRHFSVASTS